jgi:hypothetical protein
MNLHQRLTQLQLGFSNGIIIAMITQRASHGRIQVKCDGNGISRASRDKSTQIPRERLRSTSKVILGQWLLPWAGCASKAAQELAKISYAPEQGDLKANRATSKTIEQKYAGAVLELVEAGDGSSTITSFSGDKRKRYMDGRKHFSMDLLIGGVPVR